ncbi:MAG: dienelactone hydrolase family protein [Elusimicrobia bacterium]|nr:dienelactone hydrolase family protein [Elusimicrobiota bacterium]
MPGIETGFVDLPVDGAPMRAYWARPAAPGPRPGMIVLQEAFGVNAHIRDVTDRFAREGYLALAPELFHRSAPAGWEGPYTNFAAAMPHYQALTDAGLLADMTAAHTWLSRVGGCPDVCAIGFCMGGRAAFLADTALPLKAAVSFYGGGIAPSLIDHAPKMKAPILLVWGGLDKHIPPESVAAVSKSLRDAGKPFVEAAFSAADHGFHCDARASYHAPSAAQAWALALQFLKAPA